MLIYFNITGTLITTCRIIRYQHICVMEFDVVDTQVARQQIDACYRDIVVSLKRAVIGCVPAKKTNFYKFWWDTEPEMLKEDSIQTNKIWVAAGKPRFGQVYEKKRRWKNAYKQTYKQKDKEHSSYFTNMSFMKLLWENSPSIFGKPGHQNLRMSLRHVS